MSAVMNGLALHGGIIPYGGTFLTFSDYSRNALRMAALMKIRAILSSPMTRSVWARTALRTSSIEHASALRLSRDGRLETLRSGQAALAWMSQSERKDGPTSLLFTRQNVPFQKRDAHTVSAIRRGGYVLSDAHEPKAIILATGSEVQLALGAKQKLAEEGISVRVVSMPAPPFRPPAADVQGRGADFRRCPGRRRSWSQRLLAQVRRPRSAVVGIDRYGESAPGAKLFEYFGFTVENVVNAVRSVLK